MDRKNGQESKETVKHGLFLIAALAVFFALVIGGSFKLALLYFMVVTFFAIQLDAVSYWSTPSKEFEDQPVEIEPVEIEPVEDIKPVESRIREFIKRENWVPGRTIQAGTGNATTTVVLGAEYPNLGVAQYNNLRQHSAEDWMSNKDTWRESTDDDLYFVFQAPYFGSWAKVEQLRSFVFPGYTVEVKKAWYSSATMFKPDDDQAIVRHKHSVTKIYHRLEFFGVAIHCDSCTTSYKYDENNPYHGLTTPMKWHAMRFLDDWVDESTLIQALPKDPQSDDIVESWWLYEKQGNEYVGWLRSDRYSEEAFRKKFFCFKTVYLGDDASDFEQAERAWIEERVRKARMEQAMQKAAVSVVMTQAAHVNV